MRKIVYKYPKFELELNIPKEIELFMKAAHIDKEEVLDKGLWQMEAEDNVFFSHEKHPAEEGYESFFEEPLSKSKKIKVLLYGFYLTSKKLFELSPKDFIKKEPLTLSSTNIKGGIRIYFSFYD